MTYSKSGTKGVDPNRRKESRAAAPIPSWSLTHFLQPPAVQAESHGMSNEVSSATHNVCFARAKHIRHARRHVQQGPTANSSDLLRLGCQNALRWPESNMSSARGWPIRFAFSRGEDDSGQYADVEHYDFPVMDIKLMSGRAGQSPRARVLTGSD